MGQINRMLRFGGLDTRTNKLTRQPATASDCRNVFKNSNGDLIKRPDFDALDIPRAPAGARAIDQPSGDFDALLPPDALIMDVVKYEDHLFIPVDTGTGNKYYRYYEDTQTLERLGMAWNTFYDNDKGRESRIFSVYSYISGRLTSEIQQGVLYFTGDNPYEPTPTSVDEDSQAAFNNLSYIFTYDGRMVAKAGVNNAIADTSTDEGTLSAGADEYVRLLPFKIDGEDRTILGNYSTHRATHDGAGNPKQEIVIPYTSMNTNIVDGDSRYSCHARHRAVTATYNQGDTIDVDVYRRQNNGPDSIMVGQWIYNVRKTVTNPVVNEYAESYDVYRFQVTAVDYGGASEYGDDATITIDNFEYYDDVAGRFDATITNMEILEDAFLSNMMWAVYGSDDFNFGYKFRGLTNFNYNRDAGSTPSGDPTVDFRFEYNTIKSGSTTKVTYSQPLLTIGEEFEDFYDETTVKLPPPRVRHLINYLGAMVVVDHKAVYFSDISVGGSIETFTPFDTFSVGSDKRGDITGVFANETFIAVFREEEAYYITGNIFTANYRIQSYQSTRVGCTDPRSIIDFRGAGMFLSKRGFYFSQQGGAMPEISDSIETIFTDGALGLDLDLTKAKGLVDFNREYLFFHIGSTSNENGYIFCFSYYFNEWYLWGEVDADGGFTIIDSKLYYSDGNDIYKEAATSKASAAFYRTNFETLGEPSFEKKFLQVLLYTIDLPEAARMVIKTYRDWKTNRFDTKEAKRAKANQVDLTQRFNPTRSKSLAIEIESPSGQALHLNGYEYEVEMDVRMFKDDD